LENVTPVLSGIESLDNDDLEKFKSFFHGLKTVLQMGAFLRFKTRVKTCEKSG